MSPARNVGDGSARPCWPVLCRGGPHSICVQAECGADLLGGTAGYYHQLLAAALAGCEAEGSGSQAEAGREEGEEGGVRLALDGGRGDTDSQGAVGDSGEAVGGCAGDDPNCQGCSLGVGPDSLRGSCSGTVLRHWFAPSAVDLSVSVAVQENFPVAFSSDRQRARSARREGGGCRMIGACFRLTVMRTVSGRGMRVLGRWRVRVRGRWSWGCRRLRSPSMSTSPGG